MTEFRCHSSRIRSFLQEYVGHYKVHLEVWFIFHHKDLDMYFSVPQVIHRTPHGLMESVDYHVDSMDL